MEHNEKSICKTVISGKEQNLNNKRLNLEFPYFFNVYVHFGQIQHCFKVLKTDFTIQ